MAILIRVNGNGVSGGFLIAPDGTRTFPVPVGLRTDDGSTVIAVLQQAAGGAGLVFSQTNVTISPAETFVDVHATTSSGARDDTVLQAAVGGVMQASFNLTAIQNPEVWYKGRFQARFATESSYYNDPRGLSTTDGLPPNAGQTNLRGWSFILIGEPDFCPPKPASIVDVVDKAGVGRVIRFHNPVALRSHVAPIGVTIIAIHAIVGGTDEEWTFGDPVIGEPVNLGPETYFAGNKPRDPVDPAPAEQYPDAQEPLGQFQFHIGTWFSGRCATPADRPIAAGLGTLSVSEKTQYGVVAPATFRTARKNELIADYNALSGADQAGTPGQNIKTRIAHLGGGHVGPVAPGGEDVAAHPNATNLGWVEKEEFYGLVNSQIQFNPNHSAVLSYMAGFNSFNFFGKFFNFHADEQSGQVHGSLAADPTSDIPALQTGVYNVQSREAVPFNALNVSQLTDAAVDAVLAGGSVAQRVVVSVSGSLSRLVVSEAVITNPADPPASWQITSRDRSLVGKLLPLSSVFPRDLFYEILPPGHQENVLGVCEGTPFVPPPAPALGFARLFYDKPANIWKLLLHAGTNAANGITYKGPWSGATATNPTGCTAPDVELLTPTVNFGNVEEGMVMYREIVLLNRSAAPVTITLPALVVPFSPPGANSVTIAPGATGALLVAFTAGVPGPAQSTMITLSANPFVAGLDVTLIGTPVMLSTVDVSLVLDRSGSMSDPALTGFRFATKAEVRNQAAEMLVELLRDGDRIGLVRFDHEVVSHMPIEVAGATGSAQGRDHAVTALGSPDLDPRGSTCVGGGMIEGNTMLSGPSTATRKAMLVLTDGVENVSPYISSVALGAGIRAYAIGFGLPQNVNVDKLSAVTGNTGGYLLVTGDLDAQNEFRLHKYFAQVLAGISADSIVVDPRAEIGPGETQRVPFYITEADIQFDAVLLTRFPVLRFTLEAPDGTRIDAANVAGFNGQFVQGRQCRYYRMNLPVIAGSLQRNLGKWHMVIVYPGRLSLAQALPVKPGRLPVLVKDREPKLRATTEFNLRRGYNVLVRARSSIQMEASVQQRGFGPGFERTLVAHLRAFGLPLQRNVSLVAQISRPDGVTTLVPLVHSGSGRYEASLDDTKLYGTYHITVRAAGQTPGNWPLQREQSLTGVVIDPTAKSEADVKSDELNDLLKKQQDVLKDILKSQNERLRGLETLLQNLGTMRPPAGLLWGVLLLILLLIVIICLLVQQ